jgi:hypothetical protein
MITQPPGGCTHGYSAAWLAKLVSPKKALPLCRGKLDSDSQFLYRVVLT